MCDCIYSLDDKRTSPLLSSFISSTHVKLVLTIKMVIFSFVSYEAYEQRKRIASSLAQLQDSFHLEVSHWPGNKWLVESCPFLS